MFLVRKYENMESESRGEAETLISFEFFQTMIKYMSKEESRLLFSIVELIIEMAI